MRLFSILKKDSKNSNKQNYIELVECPQGGTSCEEHRNVINKSMLASRNHLFNKNYYQSIDELKTAFLKTSDLKKASCINCAKLFRSHILHSMQNLHNDLEDMSSGLFAGKRHIPNYRFASQTLDELKKFHD